MSLWAYTHRACPGLGHLESIKMIQIHLLLLKADSLVQEVRNVLNLQCQVESSRLLRELCSVFIECREGKIASSWVKGGHLKGGMWRWRKDHLKQREGQE
jgi:hypothetical protein